VREGPARFDTGDVDAGFRFGPGPYPGFHATRLSKCKNQPVIGTAYPGADRLGGAAFEGASIPILVDRGAQKSRTGTTWDDYWTYLRRGGDHPKPSLYFDRADLMLQGAIGGLGIALGRSLLIEDDIRQGLLKSIGELVRAPSDYWLVTTAEMAGSAGIRLSGEWLKEQIELTGR
jgi:LysR family glycine cleavage system transcriptional activator